VGLEMNLPEFDEDFAKLLCESLFQLCEISLFAHSDSILPPEDVHPILQH
jgi:hypothetical protein